MVSDYRSLLKRIIDVRIAPVNTKLDQLGVSRIRVSYKHLIDRAIGRDISTPRLALAMQGLNNHLGEFLYLTHLAEDIRPYRIEILSGDVILVIGSNNDEWVINTILDAKIHSKHNDEKTSNFHARIGGNYQSPNEVNHER